MIDGDTLAPARLERVRLRGIDASEASSSRYGRPDCGGHTATATLRHLPPLEAAGGLRGKFALELLCRSETGTGWAVLAV